MQLKVLSIDDGSISGGVGMIFQMVLDIAGHVASYVEAQLLYDAKSHTSYAPETITRIHSAARELKPDWVIMVLQGVDSSGQLDVLQPIYEDRPATRFYFVSGSPHSEELEAARALGLDLRLEFMPVNPEQLVNDLEQAREPD